ncbi:hypothetical protein DFP72DRAFT_1047118 [Ephemerocybe angulata]|uniref:Uncharacterized protein n=1 Tax=Ephemerocybe angulata TaxID=980116 RepID=A0A8H6HTS8_9AGAR|nr:hypothetical protein DFP72DRAFT_1047118 [Tulosesus angulatus]
MSKNPISPGPDPVCQVHRPLKNQLSLSWTRHVDHSSSFTPARSRRAEVEPDSDVTLRLAGQFTPFPGTTKIEFSLSAGRSSLFPAPILHSSLRALVTAVDCHDAPAAYGTISVARSAALGFDGEEFPRFSTTLTAREDELGGDAIEDRA